MRADRKVDNDPGPVVAGACQAEASAKDGVARAAGTAAAAVDASSIEHAIRTAAAAYVPLPLVRRNPTFRLDIHRRLTTHFFNQTEEESNYELKNYRCGDDVR